MSYSIYIYLIEYPINTQSQLTWFKRPNHPENEELEITWLSNTLAEIADSLSGNENIDIVVPIEWSHSAHLKLNASQRKYASRTVPYLLEDLIAEDVETLHFSIREAENPGAFDIRWISTHVLNHVKKAVDHLNTKSASLIFDVEMLPRMQGSSTVYVDKKRAILYEKEGRILATPAYNLTRLKSIGALKAYESVTICCADSDNRVTGIFQNIKTDTDLAKDVKYSNPSLPFSQPFFFDNKDRSPTKHAIKIIQPSYAFRMSKKAISLASILFLFLLSAPIVYNYAIGYLLSGKSSQIEDVNRETYRKLFPEDNKIINIDAQLAGKTSLTNSSLHKNSLFYFLQSIGDTLSRQANMSVYNFLYESSTNQMLLSLKASSLDDIEHFQKHFSEKHSISVNSITEMDGSIDAKITLRDKNK